MYQALYRKYRPSSFDDVYGQEHITSVLKTQLAKNKVSHAYIFCGSRGTGKTTCAKILAKAVNCENPINGEPCNKCRSCIAINEGSALDVVEMDAASNTGVDNIRRICDEVQFMPSELKKRVYIIDEVHMLSIGAFNALLKTIEEPPEYVLFILATTEMNSIPATIMSRCQRFDFKRIKKNVIIENLMRISALENISLDRRAADIIAHLSDGAMRDALSLLEACQGVEGVIDEEKINSLLGITSRSVVIDLCAAVSNQDTEKTLSIVDSLYEKYSDFKEILGSMIGVYRDVMIIKTVDEPQRFIDSYDNEYESLKAIAESSSLEILSFQSKTLQEFYSSFDRISSQKKASCEILFVRLCSPELSDSSDALIARIKNLENGTAFVKPIANETVKPKTVKTAEEKPKETAKTENPKITENGEFKDSLKLKTALQSEQFIKPWLPQIKFFLKGNTLSVVSGSFVKGMLISCGAESIILDAARKINEEIANITFAEENNIIVSQKNDGFGEL